VEPDLPDEADESPDGNADRRDDQDDGGQAVRPGNAGAETRDREEYYVDLRTAVSTEESTTVQRITAEEKAAAKKWDKQTEGSYSARVSCLTVRRLGWLGGVATRRGGLLTGGPG
jgi:hypothetical protein